LDACLLGLGFIYLHDNGLLMRQNYKLLTN